MKYKPILEQEHPAGIGGIQKIYRAENGYGLSLVNSPILHNYSFAWEAAVLKNVSRDGETFDLDFETGLTDDVVIFSTNQDMEKWVKMAMDVLSMLSGGV